MNKKLLQILAVLAVVIIAIYVISKSSGISSGSINTRSETLATILDNDYSAMKVAGKDVNVSFSPDGHKAYYVVQRGSKSAVFVNGVEGTWYDSIDNITVSPDGNHFVYTVFKGDKQYIVYDGVEKPKYGYVQNIVLSNDGKHLAYTVTDTDNDANNGNERMVLDDKFSDYYDHIYYSTLSPSGDQAFFYGCIKNNCSFVSQDASGQKKTQYAYDSYGDSKNKYGNVKDNFDFIGHGLIRLSPAGNIIAFVSRMGDRDQLNVNGSSQWPSIPDIYKKINIHNAIFSADGAHLSYVIEGCLQFMTCDWLDDQGKFYIVADSEVLNQTPYDGIEMPSYNKDGSILAYFAKKGTQWFLVVNGTETAMPTDVKRPSQIVFNPKDNSIVYQYTDMDGKNRLVQNGKEVAVYDGILLPSFTPKNQLVFTAATGKKLFVVVDGIEKKKYDIVNPFLSLTNGMFSSIYEYTPDGNNIVYGAVDGKNILWVVDPI